MRFRSEQEGDAKRKWRIAKGNGIRTSADPARRVNGDIPNRLARCSADKSDRRRPGTARALGCRSGRTRSAGDGDERRRGRRTVPPGRERRRWADHPLGFRRRWSVGAPRQPCAGCPLPSCVPSIPCGSL